MICKTNCLHGLSSCPHNMDLLAGNEPNLKIQGCSKHVELVKKLETLFGLRALIGYLELMLLEVIEWI
jgi:hypothetical protein